MFKLVVLSALLAVAFAKPSLLHGAVHHQTLAAVPALSSAVTYESKAEIVNPAIHTVAAAPALTAYAAGPAVATYAAPAVATVAAAPAVAEVRNTVVGSVPEVQYAAVPVTGTAYSKNVHYAEKDVVTGYSSQIYKPNLGALATPLNTVQQTAVLAPARAVQTLTPTVTQVQPEVSVNKVTVDVPVHTPVVSEVEVHTPIVKAAPVVATAPVAAVKTVAPAVSSYSVAAPAVATYAAAAPAVATYAAAAPVKSVAAVPAINSYAVAAPAISGYSVAAPAVATYAAAAPALRSYSVAAPAVGSYAAPLVSTQVTAW